MYWNVNPSLIFFLSPKDRVLIKKSELDIQAQIQDTEVLDVIFNLFNETLLCFVFLLSKEVENKTS